MKKKALSLLLAMTMMLNFIVPAMAVVSTDHEMVLAGSETETFYNDVKGITFDLKLRAPQVGSTASVLLKIDASKLRFVSYALDSDSSASGDIPVTAVNSTTTLTDDHWNAMYGNAPGYINAVTFIGGKSADGAALYLGVQPEFKAIVTSLKDTETTVCSFRLAFQPGVDENQLDIGSVQVLTVDEANMIGQSEVAVIPNGSGDDYIYAPVDTSIEARLAKPTITYPNSDVRNLGAVEVEMDYTAVNAPVLLPTAEEARTVNVKSVKAFDTAGNAFDTAEADKVVYTYSLKKAGAAEGDPAVTLSDTEAPYFSIDATTGSVTIQPGAPVLDLVVVASGSYTNSKNNVSTADGEGRLSIRHGDAGTVDPEGGDPTDDEEIKFSGVIITKGGVTVVTSAEGSSYSETVGIPQTGEADNVVTFAGTPVDQFGGTFTGVTGTWDDSVTTGSGTSVANGVVTVAPGAGGASFDYKYSANDGTDTYEAKVAVTVSNTVIVWPTLTNDTIVYGQPISDFTFNTDDCSVTDYGVDVTDSASFVWKVDDEAAALPAGTNQLFMECSYAPNGSTEKVTVEKEYAITVDKADQVITIAQDGETQTALVNIEIGLMTDLAPVVKNKTVADATGMGAISYSALGGNTSLVTQSNSEITGAVLSANADDTATLTLTAAGNDNYNEATRTLTFYVMNQLLRAQIVFDKTTPIAGQTLTATVTESTDPVQDGSLFDTSGVMIGGLSHSWFRWSGVEGEDPVEITGAASTMSQPDTATEEIKVSYVPTADDVGKYLILTIVTPTGATGYQYLDKSSKTAENAVIKGTPGKPSLSVQSKTTSSITITPVDGAEYAITQKTAVPSVIDESEPPASTPALAWQDGNAFTGLTPNTEYDVYIRMKETGINNSSDYETLAVRTDAISIDPENPSSDPAVVFTQEPSVTINGDAKFGTELEAVLTDAQFTLDGVEQTGPFYTEYQWYRNTPAVTEGDEATSEAITDATGDKYTLTADDIGKTITVKVTPAAASPYSGEVSATTATVDKADGPEAPTGITNTTKATNATSADGVLSGVDDTMEYRLKADEEAEETEWTAVAENETTITGLNVGTYEIRVKETDTTKAGAIAEAAVEVNGYNITGKVKSYNALKATTYKLYNWDGVTYYKWSFSDKGYADLTPVATGVMVEAQDTSGTSAVEQSFTIPNVVDGTYMLVVEKPGHLSYTVYNVIVNGGDLDLTVDTRDEVKVITLCAGDVNGDGRITVADKNVITNTNNYGKDFETMPNPEADLNGDVKVTVADKNIVTNANAYGKTVENFVTK